MNVEESRTAIYARVSSNRQEREHTIESQLVDLRSTVQSDGHDEYTEYVDEGYSRSDLARPRLDNLRDAVREGRIDRIYVHAVDRLASGTALVVLYEEFTDQYVEVVFLHGDIEDTPEGRLLLHVQAGVGDYERAKTAERTRRGKLYWARQGNVPVGVRAYGYKMTLRTGDARATLKVVEGEAAIIRLIYRLLVEEEKSLRRIADALTERGVATPRGAPRWRPTTVRNILRNTIYIGQLRFRQSAGKRSRGKEPNDGRVVTIPVEPVVDEATWLAAQDQLDHNYENAKRNNGVNFYLLRGLIRCTVCGGKYSGQAKNGITRYRCANYDHSISGNGLHCKSPSFAARPVEDAVWTAISDLMEDTSLVGREIEQRIRETQDGSATERKLTGFRRSIGALGKQKDRLTDGYLAGAIELESFKSRMDTLNAQQSELQAQLEATQKGKDESVALRSTAEAFHDFASTVGLGIDSLTDEERRRLLQLVVEKVHVEEDTVRITTVIDPPTAPATISSLHTHHPELDSESPGDCASTVRSLRCGRDDTRRFQFLLATVG